MSEHRCPVCFGPAGDCDHFEWVEATTVGSAVKRYLPGRPKPCTHWSRVPVESCLDPEVVLAQLCLDCGVQLGAGFEPKMYGPRMLLLGGPEPDGAGP